MVSFCWRSGHATPPVSVLPAMRRIAGVLGESAHRDCSDLQCSSHVHSAHQSSITDGCHDSGKFAYTRVADGPASLLHAELQATLRCPCDGLCREVRVGLSAGPDCLQIQCCAGFMSGVHLWLVKVNNLSEPDSIFIGVCRGCMPLDQDPQVCHAKTHLQVYMPGNVYVDAFLWDLACVCSIKGQKPETTSGRNTGCSVSTARAKSVN